MANNIISSLGAGSGIDVTSLVDGLVSAERSTKDFQLDSRKEKLDAQISAYGTLKSSLSEFQGVLKPLSDPDTFSARAVSFPDTDIITPNKLDADAKAGNYQIEVLSVAQSQSLATGYLTDSDLAAGDITFKFGNWSDASGDYVFSQNVEKDALTITVEAGDTLQSVVSKINASDVGLQASLVEENGQSRLLLTAPSGANNALEISASAGLEAFVFNANSFSLNPDSPERDIPGGPADSFAQTQPAADAVLKVNGLQVKRDSNSIDDLIQGLDFSVNKAAVGEKINFSITADNSVGEQAIRDFVEGYNALFETMKNLTGTRRDEETNEVIVGGLATDGSAKTLVSRVRQAVTAAVPGLDSANDFSALTNLGIRTKLDGTLEIIEKEFSAALKDNFDRVGDLFAAKSSASDSRVTVGYGSYIDRAIAGSYDVNITTQPAKGFFSGTTGALPATTGEGGGYNFAITVDGTKSGTLTLPDDKVYNSEAELAADLQTLINGDTALSKAGAKVDVSFADGVMSITSRQYGSVSEASISSASAAMDALLGVSSATVAKGVDVAGTIGGVDGFGAGNVLLAAVGSDAYGLNLTVLPGASENSTIDFSRGLGGELKVLIDGLLSNTGTIKAREERINDQLDGIQTDREALDVKMSKYQTRLLSQFLAMESIISSLQTTGNSLDGILDRLPFTAQKN